jgi:hypothetical protein
MVCTINCDDDTEIDAINDIIVVEQCKNTVILRINVIFQVNRVIGNYTIRSTNNIMKLLMSRKYLTSFNIQCTISGHSSFNIVLTCTRRI